MNRKDFFKTLLGGAAVAAVAPEIVSAEPTRRMAKFVPFPSGGVVNWSSTEDLISATEAKIDHIALNEHLRVEADRRSKMIEEAVRKWNSVFEEHRKELDAL